VAVGLRRVFAGGNTLADNGISISGVVTKERFPDHTVLSVASFSIF